MIEIEDYHLKVDSEEGIWLGRIKNDPAPAVLLIHGSMESSRIFYSKKGKGLAPFLAFNGYDVFMADLRGKGNSVPKASTGKVKGGQYDAIRSDITSAVNKIIALKGENTQINLMAHSWGGVLVAAWVARFLNQFPQISTVTFFACKRKIYVQNPRRWLFVDLLWTGLGSIITNLVGYLPAKKMKIGSDDEPKAFFFECNKWVYSNQWIEKRDDFNYLEAFRRIKFPPVYSITGKNDKILGNEMCMNRMLKEINAQDCFKKLLSKESGNKHDYDHINILTHPDAPNDHFTDVLNWLNQYN